jgi:hypothetical protein
MPRPRTPSYCLHKASGQAVVRIAGKDCYLGEYGSPENRAEYDRLIGEWLSNGRNSRLLRRRPALTWQSLSWHTRTGRKRTTPAVSSLTTSRLRSSPYGNCTEQPERPRSAPGCACRPA